MIFAIMWFFLFKSDTSVKKSTILKSTVTPSLSLVGNKTTAPSFANRNKEMTIELKQVNDSKEIGKSMLKNLGDKTEIIIDLLNFQLDRPQPARIHEGTCPVPGFPKFNLSDVVNGYSISTISASLEEILNLRPLSIYIVKMASTPREYVSCGDLK
ncbi:hypothetical protein HY030_04420 [Candidatus Gottesmanbacteria bacterium]|nr:hypothetical protein [Candidatus Gottesmanbacteria bacterium]